MHWEGNGGCLSERHHGDRQHVLLEEQSLVAYMAYMAYRAYMRNLDKTRHFAKLDHYYNKSINERVLSFYKSMKCSKIEVNNYFLSINFFKKVVSQWKRGKLFMDGHPEQI